MLEIALPPSVHPCHTALERENMSEKKRSESTREAAKLEREKASHDLKHHRYGRSSADDPGIASTRTEKHVSSNARPHPRAERESGGSAHSSSKPRRVSNHVPNHVISKSHDPLPSNGKRKRSAEEEEDVWTEHTSSSGRVYFYNKKLDKSQWERPKGAVKKPKTELTPSSSSGGGLKGSSISKHYHSSSHYSSGSAHKESSYHGDSNHRESSVSGHKDHAHSSRSHTHHSSHGSHGDKDKSYGSHHHPHHPHKRHSHSRSTSPIVTSSSASKYSGSHDKDRTPSSHRSASGSSSTSKSVTSPLTASKTAVSTVLISPGTPSLIPATYSAALSNTQQIIDQGLMIIEEREKLIAGDGMTPPVSMPAGGGGGASTNTTPAAGALQQGGGAYTPGGVGGSHPSHPHARQKLIFNQVANGPYDSSSAGSSTPPVQTVYSGATPTPVQSNIMANMDSMGLHPLQKALLLQNQFSQQGFLSSADPSHMATAVATVTTPPVGIPVPALPFHMGTQQQQQSHPGSPLIQSPILNLAQPVSTFTSPAQQPAGASGTVLQSMVAMAQASPYATPPVGLHGTYLTHTATNDIPMGGMLHPLATPTIQTPMFRLGYRGDASSYANFPDAGMAKPAPPSEVNFDLYNRQLTDSWAQFNDPLQKQMESCSHETEARTTEMIALSGRVNRTQLILKTSQVRVNSRQGQIAGLRKLMQDIDKR